MKTKEELEKIKAELMLIHNPLYTIDVPVDEDEIEFRTIFLKKFDRTTLNVVQKLATGNDSLKAVEVFLKNCIVGGDDLNEIISNLDMLRSLESVVVEMISVKQAKLKKN